MASPTRRRPGAVSPLTAQVEPIITPTTSEPILSTPPERESTPAAPIAAPVASTRAEPEPAPVLRSHVAQLTGGKRPSTTSFYPDLKASAETAVLTGKAGVTTLAELVNVALAKELDRLAAENNGGEPFPPNVGVFRTGRPLGGGSR